MIQPPDHAVVVDAVPEDVKPIADAIRKNECMLFLGAGVHACPPEGMAYEYPDEHRPLRGGELAAQLAEWSNWDLPDEKPQNLGRVALYSEIKRGRKALIDQVCLKVQEGKLPSPALLALAEIDFPMIATTNYDQLFEQALRAHGRKPSISIYKPDRFAMTDDYVGRGAFPTPEAPFLMKIHGDVDKRDSIVITDEDYIHFVLRMGDPPPFQPIPQTLKFGLMKHVTLFIGYSLLDYNLRLLLKTLRWQIDRANIPNSYVVDPYPDRLIRDVYDNQERFVHFIVRDVWSFVPMLYRELKGRAMPSGQAVAR